ncbi:MAG: hypothetical protein IJZ44_05855 [Lachnospiraceae bacterium]|nr:hypothetical protein [Lachnospiraceae bacterium]
MKNIVKVEMKLKPLSGDFEAMPEVDFWGKLDTPVSYSNSFDEIIQGLRNPEVRRCMGEELIREVYIRAYNFTSMMFAGYNSLSYISMMYAEEVKKRVLRITLEEEYSREFLVGLKVCALDGRGPVTIRPPYLKVGAETAEQAVEKYNKNVPLTSFYPAHIIAYHEEKGEWVLLSELVTADDMQKMLNEK